MYEFFLMNYMYVNSYKVNTGIHGRQLQFNVYEMNNEHFLKD